MILIWFITIPAWVLFFIFLAVVGFFDAFSGILSTIANVIGILFVLTLIFSLIMLVIMLIVVDDMSIGERIQTLFLTVVIAFVLCLCLRYIYVKYYKPDDKKESSTSYEYSLNEEYQIHPKHLCHNANNNFLWYDYNEYLVCEKNNAYYVVDSAEKYL